MKKVCFVTGESISPVEKKGIQNLTEFVLDYTFEYPACVKCGEEDRLKDYLKIYIYLKFHQIFLRLPDFLNTLIHFNFHQIL